MSKVLITESYLEDIADSIRAKNGTENTYKPSEMASAIDDISGEGTTPTGTKEISITQNGTTTEDVTNYASAEITVNVSSSSPTLQTKTVTPTESTQTVTPDSGYGGLSQVTVNPIPSSYVQPSGSLSITTNDTYDVSQYASAVVNVSGGGGGISTSDFADLLAGNLVDIDFSGVTKLRDYAFRGAKLSNAFFPDLTTIGQYVFYSATITTGAVVLPALTILPNHALRSTGASVTGVDTGASTISSNSLNGCSALTKLVLRSPTVATLNAVSAFVSTPFDSGGTGGTIYVPNALKSSYQTDTNWSTLNGYGTVTWASIEGSVYENAYVDGTAISS